MQTDIVIIGAGLTGLTTAFHLRHRDLVVLEAAPRVGGQIATHHTDGFTYESGPNTGVVSYPEVSELFAALAPACRLEPAHAAAKHRLIWKGDRFHELPSGLLGAVTTPLFSLSDKLRILGEPWRAPGTDPNESVGALALRRLGRSFVDYAVDPFLSGVYAGNPDTLVTRYALPKLYRLEQQYGSFVRGAIAKARQPKSEHDRLATKEVFSAGGGLQSLTDALADAIGRGRITTDARQVSIMPLTDAPDPTSPLAPRWRITYIYKGVPVQIEARTVVTTTGAYALPELLPFIPKAKMRPISSLRYAPVMQVSVGLKSLGDGPRYRAFGGLVPTCEHQPVLGILFPSACFAGRAPEGGALFSYFMGGVRHAEMLQLGDYEVTELVRRTLRQLLKYPTEVKPDLVRIFRHEHAIPQYEQSTGGRLTAVTAIQRQYPGLIIAGNLRGGIGMADRIRQACEVAYDLQ